MNKTLKAKTILKFLKKNKNKKFKVGDISQCPACQCLNKKLNGTDVHMTGHSEFRKSYFNSTVKAWVETPYKRVSRKWEKFTRSLGEVVGWGNEPEYKGKTLIKMFKNQ